MASPRWLERWIAATVMLIGGDGIFRSEGNGTRRRVLVPLEPPESEAAVLR